jgi:hypothetical protein
MPGWDTLLDTQNLGVLAPRFGVSWGAWLGHPQTTPPDTPKLGVSGTQVWGVWGDLVGHPQTWVQDTPKLGVSGEQVWGVLGMPPQTPSWTPHPGTLVGVSWDACPASPWLASWTPSPGPRFDPSPGPRFGQPGQAGQTWVLAARPLASPSPAWLAWVRPKQAKSTFWRFGQIWQVNTKRRTLLRRFPEHTHKPR